MRRAEFRFAQAKGFWTVDRAKNAHAIRQALAEVIEESPHSYEREIMLAVLDEEGDAPTSALAHALKANVLIPATNPLKRDPSMVYWLAKLESKAGDPALALEMFAELEKKGRLAGKPGKGAERSQAARFYGLPSVPAVEGLVMAQAEILERQQKWGEAANAYARLVEEKKGGNQVAYGYARALLKAGGKQREAKGVEVLKKIAAGPAAAPAGGDAGRAPASTETGKEGADALGAAGSKDEFWKKLAQEALETMEK